MRAGSASSLCSLVVLALLAGCGGPGEDGNGDGEPALVVPGEDFLATLCFPSTLGALRCDRRPVRAEESAAETAAVIVESLIAGPGAMADPKANAGELPEPGEDLLPALPAGVRLLAVDFIDGTAYVDLTTVEVEPDQPGARSPERQDDSSLDSDTATAPAAGRSALVMGRPAMGATEELLAVYSLVNSLTANNLGVDRVVLMWNGEQRPTFAGHIDTTRPLVADLSRNAAAAGGI